MTQTETREQVEMLVPSSLKERRKKQSGRRWLIAALVVLAAIGVLGVEIRSRVKAATNLRAVTSQMAVPSVSVVLPKQTAPAQEIVLPGNIQPYIASPIYARTDGYLKKWYFDIGAHVKAGDLLAIIQTPEVDEQLAQARSTLATAQANLELAQVTRDRYQSLLKKHAVAQQDTDNALGAYTANKAIVDADTANVRHYAALVSFEKVYAPFDGVITARNTDIGDLINSGSSTAPNRSLRHVTDAPSACM
jgi:multidrug efflux pump subunit AcrA (membrane-fusion protein)